MRQKGRCGCVFRLFFWLAVRAANQPCVCKAAAAQCGGLFRLGLEQAGFECMGHCEIDKYANKSYQAMHYLKVSVFLLRKNGCAVGLLSDTR